LEEHAALIFKVEEVRCAWEKLVLMKRRTCSHHSSSNKAMLFTMVQGGKLFAMGTVFVMSFLRSF